MAMDLFACAGKHPNALDVLAAILDPPANITDAKCVIHAFPGAEMLQGPNRAKQKPLVRQQNIVLAHQLYLVRVGHDYSGTFIELLKSDLVFAGAENIVYLHDCS